MTLVLAFALQLLAFRSRRPRRHQRPPPVFLDRGIRPGTLPYLDRAIEYPVLAGFLLYGASLVWASPLGVLLVTAIAASAVFLAVTALLARRFGAQHVAVGDRHAILLYTFQNWDLLRSRR